MPYDEELADRVRELLSTETGVDERRMFGGLAFLVDSHMAVVASREGGLMLRVPPDDTEKVLRIDHVSPMVMSGRQVRGWVRISADGVRTMRQLRPWLRRGVDFARRLSRESLSD
ncbi:TfoX/Sxy family protein [Mycobacterium sp. ACS4331]|uniref:TfoX/Sxy family protein n=1 Tax=Mycobacterium sp. ACS4331 TaxID=1834121 RepID=UPI0008003E67|nr:TfoX/Sxy family protein [Mycobacterium sp. ACS4331]OBF11389.1 RNA methyltransferase [Mycobacterium sp. ACS4331]